MAKKPVILIDEPVDNPNTRYFHTSLPIAQRFHKIEAGKPLSALTDTERQLAREIRALEGVEKLTLSREQLSVYKRPLTPWKDIEGQVITILKKFFDAKFVDVFRGRAIDTAERTAYR